MTYAFTIYGWLESLNEYQNACRGHKIQGARMKSAAQKTCYMAVLAYLRGINVKTPVTLHYAFYERNRRRDHDNVSSFAHKVVQDALVQAGVLPDDGWDEISGYTDSFYVDAESPRIEVQIEEVSDGRH